MRSFHRLVHAEDNVVLAIKMTMNVRVVVGITLITFKQKVNEREHLELDRLITHVFEGEGPNFAGFGLVNKNSSGCFYSKAFTRNNRVAESVNTTIIGDFGAHRIISWVKNFACFLVANVKIAVSVANNRGATGVFGADIGERSAAV